MIKNAHRTGVAAALTKFGFGPEDASRVLSLAKTKQLPKASARVIPVLAAARGLTPAQAAVVTNSSRQASPHDASHATSNMIGHIFPGKGSPTQQFANLRPGMPVIPADQQKMFNAVAKGHELDELSVRPSPGALAYGHMSPDVVLREHNRIVTLPPGNEQVAAAFRYARIPHEGAEFMPQGMRYGQGDRLSRHARKRITETIAQRHKGLAPKKWLREEDVSLPPDVLARLKQGSVTALMKFGLEDTASTPYTISYQQTTTRPEGRASMIDQTFARNESLGSRTEGDPAATNNTLQPGLPPVQRPDFRHFGSWSTDMGGDAFSGEGGLP